MTPNNVFVCNFRGIGAFLKDDTKMKGLTNHSFFLKGTSNISPFCKGGKGDFMFSLNSQLHFASPFEKGGLRGILCLA